MNRPRIPHRAARFGHRLRHVGGWLPGALTLGNLLAGFGAILMAMQGRYMIAFWLIFAAGLLDGLDGRIARLAGTSSNFGGQLDSLCDAISFAVAPAILAFQLGVGGLGRFGWAACFIYVACGVIRLARFSSAIHQDDDFIGLPIPSAAAAVTVPTIVTGGAPLAQGFATAEAMLLMAVGLLMVSRIRYPSFKRLRFDPRPYRVLAVWAVVLAAFIWAAEWVAPALVVAYLLAPVIRKLLGGSEALGEGELEPDDDEPDLDEPDGERGRDALA